MVVMNPDIDAVQKLYAALDSSGIPFALGFFPDGECPGTPFGCYLPAYGKSMGADGITYAKATCWQVELYTAQLDPDAESRIETALEGYRWEMKFSGYLKTEQVWQTVYRLWI